MDLSHTAEQLLGANVGGILRRMSIVGEDLTGRRLAQLSGVPVASAARALAELEKIGLVTSRSAGSARLYALNRAHVLWDPIERILAAPVRVEQLAAESVTAHVGDRATVATFGSFARGDSGPDSDIDLLIVWDDAVSVEDRDSALDALNRDLAQATGNRVEVIAIEDDDLRRMASARDPLLESWAREARTLTGVEVKTRLKRAST